MLTSLADRLMAGRDDPLTLVLRLLLLPLTLTYLVVITTRNALYDGGLLKPKRVGVPVVSIGNVTVGGTGKTPLVVHLANAAHAAGRKVAVVSTGYGAKAGDGRSDEAGLLAARCPGVDVIVAPDKLPGAREAAARGADLILLDDALQTRHLHRDLEIVVVDARAPLGNGWVLPAGSLREPASGIGRADVLVLTHHERLADESLIEVENRLRAYNRTATLVYASHRARGVRPVTGGPEVDPATLAGQELFLFAGIASTEGFIDTIEGLGAEVTGCLAFPDHHGFVPADMAAVRAYARTARLVCTEKDAAKVAAMPGNDDVVCLTIDLELDGELPALPTAVVAEPTDEPAGHH